MGLSIKKVETTPLENNVVNKEQNRPPDTEIFDIFYFHDKGKIPC